MDTPNLPNQPSAAEPPTQNPGAVPQPAQQNGGQPLQQQWREQPPVMNQEIPRTQPPTAAAFQAGQPTDPNGVDAQSNSQAQPNQQELTDFFEKAFEEIDDQDAFTEETDQTLEEWFSVSSMIEYLPQGMLAEARTKDGTLIGAIFIGKHQPLFWADGHKMEIFILAIDKRYRKQGVAKALLEAAEQYAKKESAEKILVTTHIAMTTVMSYYERNGYSKIGVLQDYYDNGDAVFFVKMLK